jgi:hypothetical protein
MAAVLTFPNASGGLTPTSNDPDTLFSLSKWKWGETIRHKHNKHIERWDLEYSVSGQEPLFGQTRRTSPLPVQYLVDRDPDADEALVLPWKHMTKEQKKTKPWRRRASPQEHSRQDHLERFSSRWTHTNSSDSQFSTDHVCQQDNIVGWDLANSYERKYCRLRDQRVFPYCEGNEHINCFDFEAGAVRVRSSRILGSIADTDSPTPRKRIDMGV